MKKYQVINFHHLLSQIDLQKVDKEARAQLISLDIILGDIVDAHDAEIKKVKSRLGKGHEAEIREVSELLRQLQSAEADKKAEIKQKIDGYTGYAEIQRQLDEEITKRLTEDVAADIEKISASDLAQWCADSGISITLEVLREFRKAHLII